MTKKTVSEKIIEYVTKHADRLNSTPYFVIEFVIQNGRADGARFKIYDKFDKDDVDNSEVLRTYHRM